MVQRSQVAPTPPFRQVVQRAAPGTSGVGVATAAGTRPETPRLPLRQGKDLTKTKIGKRIQRTPPKMTVRNHSDVGSAKDRVKNGPTYFARRASEDGNMKLSEPLADASKYAPPNRGGTDLKASKVHDFRSLYRTNSLAVSLPKWKLKKNSQETIKSPTPTAKAVMKAETKRAGLKTPSPRQPKAAVAVQPSKEPSVDTAPKTGDDILKQYLQSMKRSGSTSSQTCSLCGKNQTQNGHGICHFCIDHFRKKNVKVGTLEEFKAFATNVAHTVKKIVAVEEKRDGLKSLQDNEELLLKLRETIPKIIEGKIEEKDKAGLQRYMTDLVVTRQKNPELQARSSSFAFEEKAKGALVPLQACTANAITFGAMTDDVFLPVADAEPDDTSLAIMGPCEGGVCMLPPRKSPSQTNRPLAIDFHSSPSTADNDIQGNHKEMKKSKTFFQLLRPESSKSKLNSSSKTLQTIEFSEHEVTNSKSKVLEKRAKTEMDLQRYKPLRKKDEEINKKKRGRDKSSSVDPPQEEIVFMTKAKEKENAQLSETSENKVKKSIHPSRSVTLNSMKRPNKASPQQVEKTDKAGKKTPNQGAKSKTLSSMKYFHPSNSSPSSVTKKESSKKQRRIDDDDEEEEDNDENCEVASPLKPYLAPYTQRSAVLTSDAILALEKQRKKQMRRVDRTNQAINHSKYCDTNQGKVGSNDTYMQYKRASSPDAFRVTARPTLVRSASSSDTRRKARKSSKSIYYEGNKYAPDVRRNERSTSRIRNRGDNEWQLKGLVDRHSMSTETGVDNGMYASPGLQTQSGLVPHQGTIGDDELVSLSSDEQTSYSEVSAGSALRRDLALGSGENPTWRKSPHYFEGILGHVYKFAKDFAFQNPPVLNTTSAFGGGSPSDSVYTGGFFSNNPFYANENPSSSSSSTTSSNIYYESDSFNSENLESSKSDIYTGDVFSSTRCHNNNQGETVERSSSCLDNVAWKVASGIIKEVLQDGSANNSTRTAQNNRRQRVRSTVRGIECQRELLSVPFMENVSGNVSNNSSNEMYLDDSFESQYMDRFSEVHTVFEQRAPMCSTSSEYTDYDPYMRIQSEPEPQPEPSRPFDFAKYESWGAPTTGMFFEQAQSSGLCRYGNCDASAPTSAKNSQEESDIFYTNKFSFNSYSNENNSFMGSWGQENSNNNYPNYEQLYSGRHSAQEEERRRQQEAERLRRLEEEVNSYTGFRPLHQVDSREAYGESQPHQFDSSSVRMNPMFAAEPEPAPAYFDMPVLDQRMVIPVAQQEPKAQMRPMIMKLGAITVRNNVENDNHYAANINMDLKGGPGAHPVPFEDNLPMDPVAANAPDSSWQRQEDAYTSIYSSDRSYSDTGSIMSNWRDGTSTVARESWRGEPKIVEAGVKRTTSVSPESSIKPSFPKDKPRPHSSASNSYASIQQVPRDFGEVHGDKLGRGDSPPKTSGSYMGKVGRYMKSWF